CFTATVIRDWRAAASRPSYTPDGHASTLARRPPTTLTSGMSQVTPLAPRVAVCPVFAQAFRQASRLWLQSGYCVGYSRDIAFDTGSEDYEINFMAHSSLRSGNFDDPSPYFHSAPYWLIHHFSSSQRKIT